MRSRLRVLFVSRMDFGLRTGGVQLQVQHTRQALESLGVEVRLCAPWQDSLADVDVCHLFTTAPELFLYAQSAKERRIPLVVTPVFNSPAPLWQTTLKARLLTRLPGMYTQLRLAQGLLSVADAVLPATVGERAILQKVFGVPSGKLQVVPNGVESRFGEATPDPFVQRFGFRPDVLFVGRIDRNKNLLSLVEALAGTGLHLAVIGSSYAAEPQVFEQFLRKLGPQVTYVGSLEHEDALLASAYAAARVFCLPSIKEVMPLTVLEALVAGCRVVLTRNSAMHPFLGDAVHYVNPRSPADIRDKVLAAGRSQLPRAFRQCLLEACTWDKVGAMVHSIYARLPDSTG